MVYNIKSKLVAMYYKPMPTSCSSSLRLYLHNTENTEELPVGLPTTLKNINL